MEWVALLLFLAVIVLLLAGFPVAFSLGGTALIFAFLGVLTGSFEFHAFLNIFRIEVNNALTFGTVGAKYIGELDFFVSIIFLGYRCSLDILYQIIYFFENLFIILYPRCVIFPSIFRKYYPHETSINSFSKDLPSFIC